MEKSFKKYMPDVTDVFVFAGIILIGAGTWIIGPPISLIAVGILLLLLGLAPYITSFIKAGK